VTSNAFVFAPFVPPCFPSKPEVTITSKYPGLYSDTSSSIAHNRVIMFSNYGFLKIICNLGRRTGAEVMGMVERGYALPPPCGG